MVLLVIIYIWGWLMALGGSAEGWAIVILGTIGLIGVACFDHAFNNYDSSNVSIGKMAQDAGKCSKYQTRKNMMAGKYDKDSNHVI